MTPKLVKGSHLSNIARKEVLAAFNLRWTVENVTPRIRELLGNPTAPIVTDKQWLAEHAFYIKRDGHLASSPAHCEPAYMAD